MLESIITILFVGFLSGFVFAMPIAGPISILITSNALKGKLRFCIRTAMGASIIEFLYVLIAVYGMTFFVSAYSQFIPYLLIVGSIFLFFVGVKILKSKFELSDVGQTGDEINRRIDENKGGFRAGLIINLTNHSLFFGLLTSSFIVLSFVSSVGLNTGGLEIMVEQNIKSMQEFSYNSSVDFDSTLVAKPMSHGEFETAPPLLLSVIYAVSLALGGFLWLYILARLLIKYRTKIKLKYLQFIIQGLSFALFGISIYLLWTSFKMLSA